MNTAFCKTSLAFFLVLMSVDSSAMEEQLTTLKDLPFDSLKTMTGFLNAKDFATLSCVDKTLLKTTTETVRSHPDAVQLEDGRWMLLQQALEQNCIAKLKPIKDLHLRLNSSEDLRDRFIQAMIRGNSDILNNCRLNKEEKDEKHLELHQAYVQLGLLSTLFRKDSATENLASILIGLEVWAQTWEMIKGQVRAQVAKAIWSRIDENVKVHIEGEGGDADWSNVWVQIWDLIEQRIDRQATHKLREQEWNTLWNHVDDQMTNQIACSSKDHFNFCNAFFCRALQKELSKAYSYLTSTSQVAALIALHSPEIDEIHHWYVVYLSSVLDPEQCAEILREVEIPNSENIFFDTFLQILKNSQDEFNCKCSSNPWQENHGAHGA